MGVEVCGHLWRLYVVQEMAHTGAFIVARAEGLPRCHRLETLSNHPAPLHQGFIPLGAGFHEHQEYLAYLLELPTFSL